MDKDIKFPDRHARRESRIWFPVVVDGINIDCTITDEFIDQFIRGDSVAADEDIFMANKDIINKLVEHKIKNHLYDKNKSISITVEHDSILMNTLSLD